METKFLYLDESGDPGWPSGYGGNSRQYFVYAGVILDSEQNLEAKEGLSEVLNAHFSGFAPTPDEVHYADAVHGNGKYDFLTEDEREDLRDDLFDLILGIEPTLMATVVDKKRLISIDRNIIPSGESRNKQPWTKHPPPSFVQIENRVSNVSVSPDLARR